MVIPFVASAQRIELYTYNSFTYVMLRAYGLQRDVVKSNAEMRASQMNSDGTGVMRRHHTTKGFDERIGADGYNANDKISFAFIVAPRNVRADGSETSTKDENNGDLITWAEASGWDTSLNTATGEALDTFTGLGTGESILASKPTGCAAYRGMNGTDKMGEWRLPTQREIQVMFTVIEQSMGYIYNKEVDHEIIQGIYWTSTEFFDSTSVFKAWSISSITGRPNYDEKSKKRMARCVKDIYETINE